MKPMIWILLFVAAPVTPRSISAQINPNHTFQASLESDVLVVVNAGGTKYHSDPFTYTKILVLEQDEDNEASLLSRPYPYSIDNDGNYFVPDPFNQRVAVFDGEGQYQRSFGRNGEGPGEFLFLHLADSFNGNLAYFDPRRGRTSYFRPDGTLIEVIRPPSGSPMSLEGVFRLPGNRTLTAQKLEAYKQGSEVWKYIRVVILSAEGDTMLSVETTPALEQFYTPPSPGFSGMYSGIPLGALTLFSLHPDNKLVIWNGYTPELLMFSFDGKLTTTIDLGLAVPAVSRFERRAIQGRLERDIERMPSGARAMMQRNRDAVVIPEVKGFGDHLQIDDHGYYWIRIPEIAASRRDQGGPAFLVLSPEGELLGITRWPVSEGRIEKGRLLGIGSDATSGGVVPIVFRIQSSISGFDYPN